MVKIPRSKLLAADEPIVVVEVVVEPVPVQVPAAVTPAEVRDEQAAARVLPLRPREHQVEVAPLLRDRVLLREQALGVLLSGAVAEGDRALEHHVALDARLAGLQELGEFQFRLAEKRRVLEKLPPVFGLVVDETHRDAERHGGKAGCGCDAHDSLLW